MALHEEGQDEEAAEAYYFAIRDREITISASILEKAAELSFKIKKFSYAIHLSRLVLRAYVKNKLPIPAEILERIKDLNEITSHMSLNEYDLADLMWINEYTGNLENVASVLKLLLKSPRKIIKNHALQKLLSCYVSLQNHDKVFEITDQVLQRHAVSVSVPFDLYKACGEAHLKLGRPDVAAKFFAFAIHALELPPYHKQPPYQPFFELHRLLGRAHEKMGEAAKALEIYNKAIEVADSARTQFQMSLSSSWLRKIAKKNSNIGNIEQAIFCYEEACRAYIIEEQAIPLKILTELEKMVQGRTNFTTKALFCLAEIYFKFGKFEKAIRYYKMNISNAINKKSEYYYKSIFNLALSYEAQGKLKKAVKFYKLAHDVFNSLGLPVKDILSKLSDLAPKIL
jgi:tetratricopeptide (TPR) repeat protein